MITPPATIIFDFGGVLLDIDLQRTIAALERLGIKLPATAEIHPNNTGIFLESETGDISPTDFFTALQSYSDQTPKPSVAELQNAWCALLLPYNWARFELLDKLRAAGHTVYLLSNTNEPHHVFFEERFNRENPWNRTFRSFFDTVFYSDELRMRKPNEDIYREVALQTGLTPAQTVFIDDNAPNLVAPAMLGWQTHHLTANQDVLNLFKGF